jgi:UDP-glucose 4-epimerase
MITSLVTGGAGFIGAHITNDLLKMGQNVIVLDDLSGGFKENVNSKATFVQGSINNEELVYALFEKNKIDYVFHLAAYAAEGLSHFIRRFNYENNLIGSINLINASIKTKVKCFVFTSSIAVYGAGQLPLTETTSPLPEDPYGIAKLAIEMDLKAAHEIFDLNYIIFRPHNVYGEFQNIGDRYRNVIGIFINQLMQGQELTVFGDGSQTRAFTYIKDVAPYIANSINISSAYNQIFNIGADQNYTVKELAETVMEIMHTTTKIRYLPARNEVVDAYSDHSKAKGIFNIDEKSFISLKHGVGKMVSWAKTVGARKSSKFKNIEIFENIPKVWLES